MIGIGEHIDERGANRVLLDGAQRVEQEQRRDHEEEEEISGEQQIGDLTIAERAFAERLAAVAAHAIVCVDDLADYDERTYEHDKRRKHHVKEYIDPRKIIG